MERRDHVGPVGDHAGFDALADVLVDKFARVFPGVFFYPAPTLEPGLVKVCVRRFVRPCALWVVRPRPSLAPIEIIAEDVIIFLPAWGARVVRLARGKLHTRDHEVQLMMLGMRMAHPQDVVLVRLQSGEGHGFKAVHELVFHLRRDVLARRPGEHAGGEFPHTLLRINEFFRGIGIPPQHSRGRFLPPRIIHPQQVVHRADARAFAMRKHLHIHGYFRSSRRIASSRKTTWIVSSPFL